jgi:hypothetical protein
VVFDLNVSKFIYKNIKDRKVIEGTDAFWEKYPNK